jgi:uncharacterized membrane protein YqjE
MTTPPTHDGSRAGRDVRPGPGARTRGIGTLLGELMRELRSLARNEVELARTDIGERLSRAQSGAGGLGAAAVVAIPGLVMLLYSATLGLDVWLDRLWLSALISGAVALVIAAILASWGRRQLKAEQLAPRRTAESLQRDAEVLRREGERPHTPSGTREEARR